MIRMNKLLSISLLCRNMIMAVILRLPLNVSKLQTPLGNGILVILFFFQVYIDVVTVKIETECSLITESEIEIYTTILSYMKQTLRLRYAGYFQFFQ